MLMGLIKPIKKSVLISAMATSSKKRKENRNSLNTKIFL
jgi:hypothetical protein